MINLTLLITMKTNVRCQVKSSCQRRGLGRRGKLGSEKVFRGCIRQTVTNKKRGLVSCILSIGDGGRPGVGGRFQQTSIHPTSSPIPECSASGLPLRFDTTLKVILLPLSYLPVVVPSLPTTAVPAEKDSLPPSEGLL